MKYGDVQHLADGATVTGAGSPLLTADDDETSRFLLRPRGRASGSRASSAASEPSSSVAAHARPRRRGRQWSDPTAQIHPHTARRVWFLPTLAILMCTLALIAVAHALITGARRRRHELAVLKALGFVRGQVRATLAWEATPARDRRPPDRPSVRCHRWPDAWSWVAHDFGVAAIIAVPAAALVLLVPARFCWSTWSRISRPARPRQARTSVALAAE